MAFTHTVCPTIWTWLVILVPFTIGDSAYIFLRPDSLPGGPLNYLWPGYTTYSTIDLMYSRKEWESGNGFVAAHCVLNLLECVFGAWYLALVFSAGERNQATGKTELTGDAARRAVVLGLIQGAMTVDKTILCCKLPPLGNLWPHLG